MNKRKKVIATQINFVGLTKGLICLRLAELGHLGYTYRKEGRVYPLTRKLRKKIFSDPELVKKLGWVNETDFVKHDKREFSPTQGRILIEFFGL